MRRLKLVLPIVGFVVLAAPVAWDLIRGRAPSIDARQTLFMALGLALLVGGILLWVPPIYRRVESALAGSLERSPGLSRRMRGRYGWMFMYAAWFGLFAGLFEVGSYAMRKLVVGELLYVPFPTIWVFPFIYVAGFALVAGFLALLAKWRPDWNWPLIATTVFSSFALAVVIFLWGRIGEIGAILLSIGIAVNLSRLLVRHSHLFRGFVKGSFAVLVLTAVVVAAVMIVAPNVREWRANRGLAQADSAKPNVLFIVLDTVRARSLSLYGYERDTSPNLKRLAERGVVFDYAFSTAPWTLPSHASMFTGRYPHELEYGFRKRLSTRYPFLAEAFHDRGYYTAGIVGNLLYCSTEFGIDRGFAYYRDHIVSIAKGIQESALGQLLLRWLELDTRFGRHDTFGKKSADLINEQFLDWLGDRDDDRPFFAFLNYFDAHDPYLPPSPFDTRFRDERPMGYVTAQDLTTWTPAEIAELRDAYDAEIAYLDDRLGRLFDELEEDGVLDNTIVIITADHGEHFGEHGLLLHTGSLYEPLLRVPLLVFAPNGLVPAGTRISQFVSLRDLAATVVELAGIGNDAGFPGSSLSRFWTATDSTAGDPDAILAEVQRSINPLLPKHYPSRQGPMRTVLAGSYQYIVHQRNGEEELYDLRSDMEQERDLMAGGEGPDSTVAILRGALARWQPTGVAANVPE
ncbi:MAG TPA: sulfatase [Rhodothermales bacterium]